MQTYIHLRCKRFFIRGANRSPLEVRRCECICINTCYRWLVHIILYLKVETGIFYKIFTRGANGISLKVRTNINSRCKQTFTRGANGSSLEGRRCEGIWINNCNLWLVLIILYSKVITGILYKIFTQGANGTSLEMQTDIHSRCNQMFTLGANGSSLDLRSCEGFWINSCYLWLVLIILYSKIDTGILYNIFTLGANETSLELRTDLHSSCKRIFTRDVNGFSLEVQRCGGNWINTSYLWLFLIILYSKVETGILYKIFTQYGNGSSPEVQTDLHSRCKLILTQGSNWSPLKVRTDLPSRCGGAKVFG